MSFMKLHGDLPESWWSDNAENQSSNFPLTKSAVVVHLENRAVSHY